MAKEGVRAEIDTPAGAAAPTRATGDGGAARSRDAAPAHQVHPASGAHATCEWAATVAALELQGLARELASNCELVAVEDSRVRLRLAPEHRQLASGRGPQRLEEALSAHHGRSLELAIDAPSTGASSRNRFVPAAERPRPMAGTDMGSRWRKV
jgi:DNA polymerase-3 subunit gamma/tau